MGRALFVTHQVMADVRIVVQGVVHQQGARPRVAEDGIHPFFFEAFQQDLGSGLHDLLSFSYSRLTKIETGRGLLPAACCF